MIQMLARYKVMLSSVALLLILSFIVTWDYLSREKSVEKNNHALVYVDGDLSFNFIDGNLIDTNEEQTIYHFSVTNTSVTPYYYNLSLSDLNNVGEVNYEVESNREGFQTISKKYPDADYTFANTIKINGNETHSYTFTLMNPNHEVVKGKINIELEKDMNIFANIILKNNIVNSEAKTKVGEEISQEEEGLIESSDDYGTSYYFRGNVANNYVVFAGLSWRIVKINGDGTIKLVLDELINNNIQYYKNEEFDLNFINSNIYEELTSWYNENLNPYDHFIANYKYCMDGTSDNYGYSALTRIYTNHDPIFQCLGETSTLKIGLLTADEVALAGAIKNVNNQKYYLYNENITGGWWTLSPAKNNNGHYSFIEISKTGSMNEGTTGTLFRGNRPVINLVKKTTVTGTGTPEDPYVVNNV